MGEWWAPAPELKEFTGCDDAALRRLAKADNVNPATNESWVPAPRGGKYEVTRTLAGVIAWLRHQLEKRNELPVYATMAACPLPLAMLKHAKSEGGVECFDAAGRPRLAGILKFYEPALEKIFSGDPEKLKSVGLDSFRGLDFEQERNMRLRNEELEREKLEAENTLVMPEVVEKLFWHGAVSPLRTFLLGLEGFASQANPANPAAAAAALGNVRSQMLQLMEPLAPGNLKGRISSARNGGSQTRGMG